MDAVDDVMYFCHKICLKIYRKCSELVIKFSRKICLKYCHKIVCESGPWLSVEFFVLDCSVRPRVTEIMWMNKVRYLGVHLTSSKGLSCDYDLIKKSFYRAFNDLWKGWQISISRCCN